MYRIIHARGLRLADDYKDPYVNALRSQVRNGGEGMLLDKLLVAGIVEARGCERLFMVAEALAAAAIDAIYSSPLRRARETRT